MIILFAVLQMKSLFKPLTQLIK